MTVLLIGLSLIVLHAAPSPASASLTAPPGLLGAIENLDRAKAESSAIPGHYIVVLKDAVDHPGAVAEGMVNRRGGDLGLVYRDALKGYSAQLSEKAVQAIEHDPRVKYVTRDSEVEILGQTIPTGISRTFAPTDESLDIDEVDDVRVDADVAIIDTGIDASHPDLNVYKSVKCVSASEDPAKEKEEFECVEGAGGDVYGHGTHVGGTVGAIDNGIGVVGMAPGARLWSVRVLNANGGGLMSWVIGGVDWVAAHASQIEVANMSLGCFGGGCSEKPLNEAMESAIGAGVVIVVSAGNAGEEAKWQSPAKNPNVITVSALGDSDGLPGAQGPGSCWNGSWQAFRAVKDDELADFSNWGEVVDIAAPGVCILSTVPVGGSKVSESPTAEYGTASGTSMSAPHVAGRAAAIASVVDPDSKEDVDAIAQQLTEEGSSDWTDTSLDNDFEPLLYQGPPPPTAMTLPASAITPGQATLNGFVNPGGVATDYQFEYGPTTAYGSAVPALPQGIGSGTAGVAVSQSLSGLSPGEYHFRVVAIREGAKIYGADRQVVVPTMSLQSPPSPEPLNILTDVSCASSTMCMATGNDITHSTGLLQLWDGGKWQVVKTGVGIGLTDVSCASTTSCMAIGSDSGGAKAWRVQLSGGAWTTTVQSPAAPEGASNLALLDVSCSAASACTAVGRYDTAAGGTLPLIERWNGSSWSLQSAQLPSEREGKKTILRGVSCSAATVCVAVGTNKPKAAEDSLAEHWNGTSWSIASTPKPAGATESELVDVSCSADGGCMAIGRAKGASGWAAFAERWSSGSWSALAVPAPSGVAASATSLPSLSCASASSCVAAGSYFIASPTERRTLTAAWNGKEWSIQSSPNAAGEKWNTLEGVSCSGLNACTAVGSRGPSVEEGPTRPLAVRYE